MVEACIVPVGNTDCDGIIDVCDSGELSVGFEEVLLLLNVIAEVGFIATSVTGMVLV